LDDIFLTIAFFEEYYMSDSIGTKEASEKWGVKPATITRWCREGKIPNANQDAPGSPWHIPKDAIPPVKKRG